MGLSCPMERSTGTARALGGWPAAPVDKSSGPPSHASTTGKDKSV